VFTVFDYTPGTCSQTLNSDVPLHGASRGGVGGSPGRGKMLGEEYPGGRMNKKYAKETEEEPLSSKARVISLAIVLPSAP